MPSFSHSKIDSFENCKLRFKYQYIDRIKLEVEDTVETFLGIRVHEALEKLYRDLRFEKFLSMEDLLDYFNQKWKENWKDSIKVVSTDYSFENYRKMGERYIRDYYNRYKPFDRGRVIGLETQDRLSLDDEGRYTYSIRIDRLMDMGQGLYEVHDYKTNNTLPAQEYLDTDRQLAMYALWVKNQFKDFQKVRLVWHFVAFDKEMESFRTEKQLEQVKKDVLTAIKNIEATQDFPPNVSSLCQWCLYQEICPMWKHEKELEEKPDNEYLDDPGLKLADEYVKVKQDWENQKKTAEQKLEKLKEAIIRFSQKKGIQVVFGTDNKITITPYDSIKFPRKNTHERQALVALLKKAGKFHDVNDLDVYALSRVVRNREWEQDIQEALERYAIKEKFYSLSVSKK
ncbi:MAG: PD-(D/E)XK nuclease family protein [Candidatus Aminicenantes bacterium]|jgi:putative RecB family exonuclease